MSVRSMGEMGKNVCQNFLLTFHKIFTEEAVTTEAGSLFQYNHSSPIRPTLPIGSGAL